MTEGYTVIGFTGHRDCVTHEAELDRIAEEYPNALWCEGGAEGFDAQVRAYAKKRGFTLLTEGQNPPRTGISLYPSIKPKYKRWKKEQAPLKRNLTLVEKADLLVACFDGRKMGGTWKTRHIASLVYVPIRDVAALKIRAQATEPTMARLGEVLG